MRPWHRLDSKVNRQNVQKRDLYCIAQGKPFSKRKGNCHANVQTRRASASSTKNPTHHMQALVQHRHMPAISMTPSELHLLIRCIITASLPLLPGRLTHSLLIRRSQRLVLALLAVLRATQQSQRGLSPRATNSRRTTSDVMKGRVRH